MQSIFLLRATTSNAPRTTIFLWRCGPYIGLDEAPGLSAWLWYPVSRALRGERTNEVGNLLAGYISFAGMGALLVVSHYILAESSVVIQQSCVRHEISRLAQALEMAETSEKGNTIGITAPGGLFGFAAYLKLPPAKLISWQSLKLLSRVAMQLAANESSTFSQIASEKGIQEQQDETPNSFSSSPLRKERTGSSPQVQFWRSWARKTKRRCLKQPARRARPEWIPFLVRAIHRTKWAMNKICLFRLYRGWNPTQLYGDYNKPL